MSAPPSRVRHVFNLRNDKTPAGAAHARPLLRVAERATPLPPIVDLRPRCPPVFDQGELGSCTANALAGAYQFLEPSFLPSRLFLYYQERAADGDIPDDDGSTITQGVNVLEHVGVCSESAWPYDITQFAVAPPATAVTQAAAHKVTAANHVSQDATDMKAALAAGHPIALGIMVYESFESEAVAQTGVVPMPAPTEQCLGGHAVLCVGYSDSSGHWVMRNSWGTDWGVHGYFFLPYAYLTDANLCSDLWVITAETPLAPTPAPHSVPSVPTPAPHSVPSVPTPAPAPAPTH